MDYTYLIEEKINKTKNITLNEIFIEGNINYITILCYHINNLSTKYPFIQFLTQYISLPLLNSEKVLYYDESLFLPICYFEDCNQNIESEILKKIKSLFNLLDNKKNIEVNSNMYKGLLFSDEGKSIYALVNISELNIYDIKNEKKIENYPWFVLPSEIINNKCCFNITINKEIVQLFENNPELSLLINVKNNNYFNIPDVVYTIDNIKDVKFKSVFGNQKTKNNKYCNPFYYYYRNFETIKKVYLNINSKDKNKNLGINRYAIFIEGRFHFEKQNFILSNKEIETIYPENCIIICYDNDNENPDLLVKNNDYSTCISFLEMN